MYYIYMLRCKDNSLYTGITNDLSRRFSEHKEKDKKGAKYTRAKGAVSVEAVFETAGKKAALRLEIFIKSQKKQIKERIINDKALFYEKTKDKFPEDVFRFLKKNEIEDLLK